MSLFNKNIFFLLFISFAFVGFSEESKTLPYLGVLTSDIPERLSIPLGLADGEGLLVDYVDPKSSAHDANIQKGDILLKVGETRLFSVKQLVFLIRKSQIGESININLLRQGEHLDIQVFLGQKEFKPSESKSLSQSHSFFRKSPSMGLGGQPNISFNKLFEEQSEKMKKMIHSMQSGSHISLFNLKNSTSPSPQLHIESSQSSTLFQKDGEHSITLKKVNGEAQLHIEDQSGQLIYEGSYEGSQSLPLELREKIDRLFQMGGGAGITISTEANSTSL